MDYLKNSISAVIDSVGSALRRRLDARRYLRAANLLYSTGQFTEAAVAYRHVIDAQPKLLVARYNLGLCLYKSGRRQEARDEWNRVLAECDPKNTYLREQTGILLRQFS